MASKNLSSSSEFFQLECWRQSNSFGIGFSIQKKIENGFVKPVEYSSCCGGIVAAQMKKVIHYTTIRSKVVVVHVGCGVCKPVFFAVDGFKLFIIFACADVRTNNMKER